MSLLKRQAEVPPASVYTVSSGTPLGRRGRLANLAATIGSWEDDLSHAHIPTENAKDKPSKAAPKVADRDAAVAAGPLVVSSAANSKTTSSSNQVGLLGVVLTFSIISYFLLLCEPCFSEFVYFFELLLNRILNVTGSSALKNQIH